MHDWFEVDSTPTANLAIKLVGGDGPNFFDLNNTGNNEGITVVGGPAGDSLTLDRVQTSCAFPDSVTLSEVNGAAYSSPALSVTGTATSAVVIGVTNITDNMYGGTLDVNDLSPLGETFITVTGVRSPSKNANHVVIEPASGGAFDDIGVSYVNGTAINDFGTFTQYSITGLVSQDDVRIKLNGGGGETVRRPSVSRVLHADTRRLGSIRRRQHARRAAQHAWFHGDDDHRRRRRS